MELVRSGAAQLAEGRHRLTRQLAAAFRACRDDWRSTGRPERREAEKYRGMGCYPARLLRTPQLAFLHREKQPACARGNARRLSEDSVTLWLTVP